jgi:hypothetical protein
MSKTASEQTKALVLEASHPSGAETDISGYFVNNETGRDYVLGMQALKHIALPSDIGEVAPSSPGPPPAGSLTIQSTRAGD